MMRMLPKKLSTIWLSVFTGMVVLSGCGGDTESATNSPAPSTGIAAKYEESEGPAELARKSAVVVRGSTRTPHEGRIRGESRNDWGAAITVVVPVTIESVEAGELAPLVDDTLYLEMNAPQEEAGREDREVFKKALTDRAGIFYLTRAPEKASRYVLIVDPEAGRPAGQPLYQATSPEGILLENRDGEGVWSVESGLDFPNSSLVDFLPDQVKFPQQEAEVGSGSAIDGTPVE